LLDVSGRVTTFRKLHNQLLKKERALREKLREKLRGKKNDGKKKKDT